jgi:transcriptional regulator with GAF, ATPase, and Fis domain
LSDSVDHADAVLVADALSHAGVSLAAAGGQNSSTADATIVLFDVVTPHLYELVQNADQRCLGRLLAVSLGRRDLGVEDLWSLLRRGASDVIAWNGRADPSNDVLARLERWAAVDRLLASDLVRRNLVGHSPRWTKGIRDIIEVAYFTDTSLLVTGESGTGKELVARLIHTLDQRPDKGPLVIVDCTTVVPTLSGSEFFGHERGAFTGAVSARDGAVAKAHGGTLFLDEIGELPLQLQAELLRVIQEGTYKRVGSDTWREANFRLVCATNRRLDEAQERGEFRADLYNRIAGWACELPPLRERTEDIIPLALHFLAQVLPPSTPPAMDPAVADYIRARAYPGNIRELRSLMGRLAVRHVGRGPISIGDLPETDHGSSRNRVHASPESGSEVNSAECENDRLGQGTLCRDWRDERFELAIRSAVETGVGLQEIGRAAQETAVSTAFRLCDGNLRKAAGMLNVTERALQLRRASRASAARGLTGPGND